MSGIRRTTRIAATLAVIVAVVVALGAAFAGGLPRPAKALPTGIAPDLPTYGNVLADSRFTVGTGIAVGWLDEHSTAGRPTWARTARGQEVGYRGQPDDTGPGRKIEVFQGAFHQISGGERWQFTVRISGQAAKCTPIVGAEWFGRPASHDPTGYLAETDAYPHLGQAAQDIAVVTPPLPGNAHAIAVYVQIAEISPQTNVTVIISGALLVRVG